MMMMRLDHEEDLDRLRDTLREFGVTNIVRTFKSNPKFYYFHVRAANKEAITEKIGCVCFVRESEPYNGHDMLW